jgi:hypothetical protein
MRVSRHLSIDPSPPLFEKPTVLGWFFFARSPQCWRGFGPCCDGRRRPGQPRFVRFFVLSSRPFSVSATDAAAPEPPMTRVSGTLFVSETAFTQATRPQTALPVHDGTNLPGDSDLRSVDRLVAVLDGVLQVLGQRLVVLVDLLDGPVDCVAERVADVFSPVGDLA